MKKAGVPDESLQMVPSRTIDRDRTYSSAVALQGWMRDHQVSVRGINVLTENTHARQTRLLYQRALGKDVQVGIIAVPTPDYPANMWWRYSEGFKDVVSEPACYLYAKFLSRPLVAGSPLGLQEVTSQGSAPTGRAGTPRS